MDNNTLEISFVGDLSATGIFHEKIENHQEIFTHEISEQLFTRDFVVCNLEGAAMDGYSNIPVKSSANAIEYLTARNIKVFNLANNHIFDCGMEGFDHTKHRIAEKKSIGFGAGENISKASRIIYLRKNTVSVALIAVCDHDEWMAEESSPGVFSSSNLNLIRKKVREAKRKADFVVLSFHGGEEFTLYPSPEKMAYFKKLSRIKDLDIIVGHHSHTFQGFESINNTTVFYSLGNFIFDIDNHKLYQHINESALLNIAFSKTTYNFSFTPIKIDTAKGIIGLNSPEFVQHIHSISSFDNYYKKWLNDTYRVVFQRNAVEKCGETQALLRHSTATKAFFSPKLYKRIAEVFKDKNQRSVYLGAVLYKFCHSISPPCKKGSSLPEKG